MAATDLGKVGMVVKGAWSNSATYEILDLVYYDGASYIAKRDVPANTAPTNTTYWQLAAKWPESKIDISSGFTIAESGLLSSIGVNAYLTGNLVEFSINGYCNNDIMPKNKDICIIAPEYRPDANRLMTGIIVVNYGQDASDIKPIYYSLDRTNYKMRIPNQGGLNFSLSTNSRLIINGSYFL